MGPGASRRALLLGGLGLGLGGASALAGCTAPSGGPSSSAPPGSGTGALPPLPSPGARAVLPEGVELGVDGVVPFRVPTEDFFQIDTTRGLPRVDASTWRLRIHGEVDRELRLTYADLLARPMIERDLTISCVSNEVGGDLIGNALWLGTRIAPILAEAGPRAGADMVLSTSYDGWTASTPIEVLRDDRDALFAVGMNGQVLPERHGHPVRMVVPGLYGFVSATKWLVDLEVTRFADAKAYWSTRGWSERGPVKLSSRIDVPRYGARVPAGTVAVGGVAWSPHVGIRAVEVRVDGGDWQPARLGAVPSADTWRQWAFTWQAVAGDHELSVRAIDAAGQVQTGEVAPVDPDGATGWHSIEVKVT